MEEGQDDAKTEKHKEYEDAMYAKPATIHTSDHPYHKHLPGSSNARPQS